MGQTHQVRLPAKLWISKTASFLLHSRWMKNWVKIRKMSHINIYLYSMPSVSYNNHLIFSLHLTNCESSVLDKINKHNTAHVNGKFTRETLIKSSHLCQTCWHWSQIVQSDFIPYHANIISLGKPYDIYKNAVLSRNLIWSSSVFIIYYLDKPRFSLKAYTTDNCRQA